MSFDLTFWHPTGEPVDLVALHRWLHADERIGHLGEFEASGYGATTNVGGEPWAAIDVEDLSDLPDDDDDEFEGPPGTSPTGVRFEMSYSTPDHLVHDIIGLVEDLAGRFGWVIVDEQADTDRAVHLDDIRASWTEASAWARRVAAPPNEH